MRCLLYLVRLSCGIPFYVIMLSFPIHEERHKASDRSSTELHGGACRGKCDDGDNSFDGCSAPDDNRDCSHVLRGRCAKPKTVSQHATGFLAPAEHVHDCGASLSWTLHAVAKKFWSPNLLHRRRQRPGGVEYFTTGRALFYHLHIRSLPVHPFELFAVFFLYRWVSG